VTIGQAGVGTQSTDGFINMADAMLVGTGLDYLLLVPLATFFALPLAVVGCFVALTVIDHATNIIGLAVSVQATALPAAVIAAGICMAYSVAGGLYDVALAATAMLSAVMLSMAGIVVAAAILTPIGMPTVPTSPILMAVLPILPFLSIELVEMDTFISMPQAMLVAINLG
jgi:Na+/H+-translocating membrane pyrophosphatase